MSDEFDWDFSDPDDAKAEIRAAVGYLLNGAAGSNRGDIVGRSLQSCTRLRAACRLVAEIPWTMICLVAERRIAPT
jgi:hypothetical protein